VKWVGNLQRIEEAQSGMISLLRSVTEATTVVLGWKHCKIPFSQLYLHEVVSVLRNMERCDSDVDVLSNIYSILFE